MNLSFHKLLALVYFKNQAENYDLSELRSILGFTQIQLDKMLSELFENEYLVYKNYEMSVSEKGLNYLKKKNAEKYELASNDINLSVIQKEKAKSLDDIYIPKHFDKKYKV